MPKVHFISAEEHQLQRILNLCLQNKMMNNSLMISSKSLEIGNQNTSTLHLHQKTPNQKFLKLTKDKNLIKNRIRRQKVKNLQITQFQLIVNSTKRKLQMENRSSVVRYQNFIILNQKSQSLLFNFSPIDSYNYLKKKNVIIFKFS